MVLKAVFEILRGCFPIADGARIESGFLFSLNFYDPVNKLLAKYGATKVFLEGDAIILALLERQNQPAMSVGRACVLAREIIEIVHGYNQLLERAGLPALVWA